MGPRRLQFWAQEGPGRSRRGCQGGQKWIRSLAKGHWRRSWIACPSFCFFRAWRLGQMVISKLATVSTSRILVPITQLPCSVSPAHVTCCMCRKAYATVNRMCMDPTAGGSYQHTILCMGNGIMVNDSKSASECLLHFETHHLSSET